MLDPMLDPMLDTLLDLMLDTRLDPMLDTRLDPMLDSRLDPMLDRRLPLRMTLSRFVWLPISTVTRKPNTVVSWTTSRLRTAML